MCDTMNIEFKKGATKSLMVAIMRYEFRFYFNKADVSYVHEDIKNYDIITWVKDNSEDTMEIVETEDGFIIKTDNFNDFNYSVDENSMTFDFKFVTGADSWQVIAVFNNITIERYW